MLRIRVVSTKSEIERLNRDEMFVHLAFRASNADIFRLLQRCPQLKAIQVPASYYRTLSQAGKMFLQIHGVTLIEGDVWGHRKDLSEYLIIEEQDLRRISELLSSGMSPEDIAESLCDDMKVSPGLVRFIGETRRS
ncbi:DUF1699 family protein [Methanothrix sp.]|jgi:hypothetical protein|uniref:DUF1699 family protein n=1 Tax=Methanothrix sp. TaxID=90426 RepID=UPI00257F4C3B|nr:DUF1699 family protein [Methanothrix sp.]